MLTNKTNFNSSEPFNLFLHLGKNNYFCALVFVLRVLVSFRAKKHALKKKYQRGFKNKTETKRVARTTRGESGCTQNTREIFNYTCKCFVRRSRCQTRKRLKCIFNTRVSKVSICACQTFDVYTKCILYIMFFV